MSVEDRIAFQDGFVMNAEGQWVPREQGEAENR
ncbi:hypothetical protein L687_12360 [Microbacterium maritypicum MF109]|uniref:Uncharacterized protein n=1 Tax=Microbacterium maritypicum MF109 TaxID=1333857 RepID=T5KYK6_MICMQ|nr:hypothetical protein L687_12360 [Microbacterium maritypicum MF109]